MSNKVLRHFRSWFGRISRQGRRPFQIETVLKDATSPDGETYKVIDATATLAGAIEKLHNRIYRTRAKTQA